MPPDAFAAWAADVRTAAEQIAAETRAEDDLRSHEAAAGLAGWFDPEVLK